MVINICLLWKLRHSAVKPLLGHVPRGKEDGGAEGREKKSKKTSSVLNGEDAVSEQTGVEIKCRSMNMTPRKTE